MWERHEEKWPASEASRADASTDEPGSWRGDAGHYLNAEENLVSDHALERTRAAEEKLTLKLDEITRNVPDAGFVGLEYRLKGEERFKEKIAENLRAKPERTIAQVCERMPDAIRYTLQIPSESYAVGYWNSVSVLRQNGFEMEFSRNSWSSSQYKGINTRWRTSEGQTFEVQFHTPESFEAKQLTHEAYERIRSPSTSRKERGELYAFQTAVSAKIPVPDGSLSIPDYHRREI
jgi:hypothetical protein